ncbi:hypothetical protein HS088_TW04G00685 [Tripterygium wilfordii]|uniref:Uncharacterized protein n=1 Tax=Tripterygium wilfordii TaxID=458696 RepID=A0A7J7DQY5_TRIWF|nr:hypothetical protein HS088_TW04G00685 [Tripterygium wilfordii]
MLFLILQTLVFLESAFNFVSRNSNMFKSDKADKDIMSMVQDIKQRIRAEEEAAKKKKEEPEKEAKKNLLLPNQDTGHGESFMGTISTRGYSHYSSA